MKNYVTGKIKLSIYETPLELELTVPEKPVKPTRMLPIFQHITNKFVQVGVNKFLKDGETISCQTGCAACCRHPVPLAEIEVYQIAELVENLPEPRRSQIKEKFAKGCEELDKIQWFERLENNPNILTEELRKLGLEYYYKKIDCPFLEDESCSIYSHRPLACREYLVTSAPEHCTNPNLETVQHVRFPFKVANLFRHIGKTENTKSLNFITMIRSLEWVKTRPEKFKKKTGKQWMAEFFGALTKDLPPINDK